MLFQTNKEKLTATPLQVDAWLFSDEIYSLLEQQPQQQRLAPAVCAYPQRGISLGGLSKAFGLQGLRAGWLVCQNTALLAQVICFRCQRYAHGFTGGCWVRAGWLVSRDTALLALAPVKLTCKQQHTGKL